MSKLQNPVQMAVIGAAHGIKGELRVKTFTGDPLALADYGPLHTKDGRTFQILDIRPAGTVVVVRFKGINDRNAAEALAGTELFVDRSVLPDDGEEDEFYHADLVGLEVRDDTGAIGRVVAVHNFGGGDILDVTLAGRKGVLIPFTQAAVPHVSIADGFVQVDPLAAGLVDDEESEAPAGSGFDPKGRPRGPKDAGGNR
ncbi:ribosome maturation factor RimM [Mesorhizobium tamadayense]|uniref:Ribosome maturation factor RimM n=1 Tax=Mesorhizobium tamadayense TaxID=425306 RepID=A0A3P3FX23_9HYPH|nr:ribosome maturation factor RimM [Mesorhizobium tamadayense]RRI02643.1 ribosome maturation factor RimM [Mesorhizobium tamadayense]